MMNPPGILQWLARHLFRLYTNETCLGDLAEEFDERAVFGGRRGAVCWYGRQVLSALWPAFHFTLRWRMEMILNAVMMAVRHWRRFKGFTFINWAGLTLGLAGFFLIHLFVSHELAYDGHHLNGDRVVRVAQQHHGHNHFGHDKMGATPLPLAAFMKESSPLISEASAVVRSRDVRMVRDGRSWFEEAVFGVSGSFFSIFSVPVAAGSVEEAMANPRSLILSESRSRALFGSENALGQVVEVADGSIWVVRAVIKDMPGTGHFRMDMIMPLSGWAQWTETDLTSWRNYQCWTYLMLTPGADRVALTSELNRVADDHIERHHSKITLFIQPLRDIHLKSNMLMEIDDNGDWKQVRLFSLIGLALLGLAGINYVNLVMAQSGRRLRELGIRKVVGAERKDLLRQLALEAACFVMTAVIGALVVTLVCLVPFARFAQRPLELAALTSPGFLIGAAGAIVLLILSAGFYPAWRLARVSSAQILKTRDRAGSSRIHAKNILVIFQFAVATVLMLATWVVKGQLAHIHNCDVGFDKDQIVSMKVDGEAVSNHLESLKTAMGDIPGVLDVTSSTYLPNSILDQVILNWSGRPEDVEISAYVGNVDQHYVDFFGLELAAGRNFSDEHQGYDLGGFLVNETAVKQAGWSDPLNMTLEHWNGKKGPVVGVLKDFHYQSLHRPIEPLYLYYEPTVRNYWISLKVPGEEAQKVIAACRDLLTPYMIDEPFEYHFFSDVFAQAYAAEQRLSTLFLVFASLAVLIAGLGLLGLSIFAAQSRVKEIGVRKVMGASSTQVGVMLVKDFLKWVLIAQVVAIPLGIYLMQGWLQQFSSRMSIGLLTVGGTVMLGLSVAGAAVLVQAIRAASQAPVHSLRHE